METILAVYTLSIIGLLILLHREAFDITEFWDRDNIKGISKVTALAPILFIWGLAETIMEYIVDHK